MKTFRILFLVIAAAVLSTVQANAQTFRGQKSFGVDAGYISRNKSALAGIQFQYSFSSHFRVAPGARCIFRNNDRDAFQLDLDTHYPFNFTGDRAALYPILGVNYSWWNDHTHDAESSEDVTTRKRNLGLNAGAGFEFTASSTLKVHIDARYSLVKSNSSMQLTLGIAYLF